MPGKTKISKGYPTVVPEGERKASEIREGDIPGWSLKGDRIVIRPRRRRTIDDITGIISHGGDAVAAKRRVQRGQRARR